MMNKHWENIVWNAEDVIKLSSLYYGSPFNVTCNAVDESVNDIWTYGAPEKLERFPRISKRKNPNLKCAKPSVE